MKKIKILCLDHYTKIGGGQRNLLTLLENLDRNRFYPIVCIARKGPLYDHVESLGVDTRFVELDTEPIKINYIGRHSKAGNLAALFRNLFTTFRCIVFLVRVIKTETIDLIYSNTFRTALIGGITGRLSGTPVVYHAHIFPNHGWLDSMTLFLCDKVIANSRSVARALGRQGKWERKIEVIYNAIDLLAFNPNLNGDRIKSEFGIDKSEKLVGMVGRITPEKDHQMFVQAAVKVASALPHTRFLVVGSAVSEQDKRYKMGIVRLVEESNGLKNRFIFAGFRRDIPEVMASLDLLVVPSIKEAWGRVAAEAMAVGKPVVGTNVGGLPEIVNHGHTGILVPPEDPEFLAEATITLLKDEELRKRMGKAGRKKIEENFSIPIITKQMEELYLEVLEGVKATR